MAVTERAASMVAVALSIIALLVDSVAAATLTGKADIVDGDTIKVGGIPVRLNGARGHAASRHIDNVTPKSSRLLPRQAAPPPVDHHIRGVGRRYWKDETRRQNQARQGGSVERQGRGGPRALLRLPRWVQASGERLHDRHVGRCARQGVRARPGEAGAAHMHWMVLGHERHIPPEQRVKMMGGM